MGDKYSIKEVKTMLKYKGAKLLSDNYIKNNKKIKIECKNGHILNTSLTNFMVVGCKFCNKKEKTGNSESFRPCPCQGVGVTGFEPATSTSRT